MLVGGNLLNYCSDFVGVEVDKLAFLVCQLAAILLGRILVYFFDSKYTSSTLRHILEIIFGLLLLCICMGWQIGHLLAQSLVVYMILCCIPHRVGKIVIFTFCMSYLSIMHMYRMYIDYQGYTLDVTGPLMVLTQKMCTLGYNLHDGEKISLGKVLIFPRHVQHAILKRPTLLEFFSYAFSFHGNMVGPFIFLSDYLCFIEGREEEMVEGSKEYWRENRTNILRAWFPLFKSLCWCGYFCIQFVLIHPLFPIDILSTPEYGNRRFLWKVYYLIVACFFVRAKYYLAWELARACNLSAGFGFSGISNYGNPSYDKAKNFDYINIELGYGLKYIVASWNIGTTYWLREIVYDRSPKKFALYLTYLMSAFWHGFYPGYYLTFLSMALFTMVSRIFRSRIRPTLLNFIPQHVYDVFTGISAILCLNYCCASFILLGAREGITFWSYIYFVPHIIGLVIWIVGIILKRTDSESNRNIHRD